MNSMEAQGQRIYQMRKIRGMGQKELADKLGITTPSISNWEWGRVVPTVYRYLQLADALDCDVMDIGSDEVRRWVAKARELKGTMTLNQYQMLAQRTANEDLDAKEKLINGVMGLCGESGEVIDLVKKHLSQFHPLDEGKILDELGDVMWYIAETAAAIGKTLDDVCTHNIEKLKRRYPQGFDPDKSINRGE